MKTIMALVLGLVALAPAAMADGDGDADGRDFLIWQRHVAAPAAPAPQPLVALASGAAVSRAQSGASQ